MLAWFTGTPVKPGNILRNIFTGYLLDTLDNPVKNKEWSPVLPAIVAASVFYSPPKKGQNKNRYQYLTFFGFMFVYFLYTVIFTGGQAKFLMPVFPVMAVLSVKNLHGLYSIILKWKKAAFKISKAK